MIEDIISDAKSRMLKSIDSLTSEMSKIRTGRAHPSLLEQVKVSYYGAETPLNQVANINVVDARMLGVTAFDKSSVPDIEKAIMNANLGLNPVTTGDLIRVPLPPLTEERRKELIKVVRAEAEKARVAIRNIRRDANSSCKELVKEKMISEDDEHKAEDRIQKLTDENIATVDKNLEQKEAEMLEI
ncbi:MAG: ribosome recycling factor [Proteobacteria bacterium]|nr:ribosome recycling factor [Pseudomonadota bacterium]NOG60816.1 ribosome recycling factor [Pseudomonadota bacterium]